MNSKIVAETKRLALRHFTVDDTAFIIELLNTPGWLKFIGDRNVRTTEEAKVYLVNGPLKSYQDHGFGLWLVALKSTNTPIGMCGFLKRDYLEHPDIGFAFLPAYHGKGYALEIAKQAMKFAFESLTIKHVMAIVLPTNKSSIRLLENLGMKFQNTTLSPVGSEEVLVYSS
jgi:RimJ/RimL family protein N-acetyltransferase